MPDRTGRVTLILQYFRKAGVVHYLSRVVGSKISEIRLQSDPEHLFRRLQLALVPQAVPETSAVQCHVGMIWSADALPAFVHLLHP